MSKIVLTVTVIMSAVAFIIFGYDKLMAKKGGWRIPERVLLTLAVILGGPGAYIGMKVFHHKTLHKKFTLTVPVFAVIQIALNVFLFVKGI